ncbi:MAG TPA: aldo/keto reductase [Thermoleophilaceae bacterium]
MTTVTTDNVGTLRLGGDLEVRRLGFGAMRLTGDGIWGEPADREECRRVLRRALELGINLIDTADSYGPEVSENLIAETLHPYPDDLVIATKGGLVRPGPNQWDADGRPEHLREACEGSLRRLKVDRIDLYQLHRPDPNVPYEESLGAIKELQDEGKIRLAGVSNVDLDQLATAQSVFDVVSVQNRYNLADRSSEDVLQQCEQESIAFIPWAPLDAGNSEVPNEIALAWLLQRSPAMLPIPGTSSVEHLEQNVEAADIDAETLAEALSRIEG